MRLTLLMGVFVIIFLLGLTTGLFYNQVQEVREEYVLNSESPTGLQPYDRITEEQIIVLQDKVTIDLAGVRWANFSPTGSMLPVLGTTAHALQIIPELSSDIHIGDVVSFHLENKIISHRVISTGLDEIGWYATTQGDNNPEPDPVKVRFESIDRVLVGVLY